MSYVVFDLFFVGILEVYVNLILGVESEVNIL